MDVGLSKTNSLRSLSAPLQTFVLFSTVAMVFSEAATLTLSIDLKLFYFLIATNLALLLLIWNFRVQTRYLQMLGFVWLIGAVSVARHTNTMSAFLQQALGITICSFYFHLFFSTRTISLTQIFSLYATMAYWLTVVGITAAAIFTVVSGKFYPVQSIFTEPAHFATVVLPSLYYYSSCAASDIRNRRRAIILLFGVVLSGSSTAFFGLFACGLLLVRRNLMRALSIGAVLLALGYSLYSMNEHFRIRIDDTLAGANGFDLSSTNLSTFAFLSNAYVAIHAFQEHPIIGYGLGAHSLAHEQFIGELPPLGHLEQYTNMNERDANSLFLRIMSEFGTLGIVLAFWYLKRFYITGRSEYSEINAAILTYFLPKLLREGHWFSPEMYFFVWMYVLIAQEFRSAPRADAFPSSRRRSQDVSRLCPPHRSPDISQA